MCGIAGVFHPSGFPPVQQETLRRMLALVRHRGPDQFGIYRDGRAGLASARLCVIDLASGGQPISNEDGSLWIVFNGEIFNYRELRADLERRGHHFATKSDTEVVVHLYEDRGPACLERLNGQFAIAIWNASDRSLFLARDRLGERPLFYARVGGCLVFGSEVKAILADPRVRAELDPEALDDVFTFWATPSPRTVFRGILEVPPGSYLLAREETTEIKRYWQIRFSSEAAAGAPRRQEETEEEFRELLVDATRLRLRADVPVGAYLSGGLDSTTVAAIAREAVGRGLHTFSVTFDDPDFDESEPQGVAAELLGTEHHIVRVSHAEIGRVFPEVVWHAETPLTRTAPAPLFLLSKLVHDSRFKVVLTGEGADEFLAGYDIFKEAAIRRFWAGQPDSALRPRLFGRLYADIAGLSQGGDAYRASFFRDALTDVDRLDYSHAVRWRNSSRNRRFFSAELRGRLSQDAGEESVPADRLSLSPEMAAWGPLERAQYLEVITFLTPYLLSSQGDRMAMAHSVEARHPFLDHRLVEFCNRLPSEEKLRGLRDKRLLRRVARRWLPEDFCRRPKRPYRSPIHRSFFHERAPEYVWELLSPEHTRAAGFFDPEAVRRLGAKAGRRARLSETEDMALAGILSTHLVHRQFVTRFPARQPLSVPEDVRVVIGLDAAEEGPWTSRRRSSR